MTAITAGYYTNKGVLFLRQTSLFMTNKPVLHSLFVWQPTVTAAMWVICMTINSKGCHMDYFLKKSHFLFLKVIPRKLNLIYIYLISKVWNPQIIRAKSHNVCNKHQKGLIETIKHYYFWCPLFIPLWFPFFNLTLVCCSLFSAQRLRIQ